MFYMFILSILNMTYDPFHQFRLAYLTDNVTYLPYKFYQSKLSETFVNGETVPYTYVNI